MKLRNVEIDGVMYINAEDILALLKQNGIDMVFPKLALSVEGKK